MSESRKAEEKQERGLLSEEKRFGVNDTLLAALVVIAALLSFTDFTFSVGSLRNLTALTLFLYLMTVFLYRNRYDKGKERGRETAEYKTALGDYREKKNAIYESGKAALVPAFCAAYRKRELREYRESLLIEIEMDYEEYKERYLRMSEREILRAPISAEAKKILIKCNRAKAIRLTPGMLLNENGEADRRSLVGQSGREREKQDKKREAVSRAVYVLFGALVAVDVIFHFSLLTLIQWVIRMLPMIIAIITGDEGGYHNIVTTEVAFKQSQTGVLCLFDEWSQ
jgi:hypothetical protein